jgi:hypothetical protein
MKLEIKHLAPYLPFRLTGIASFLEDTQFVVDTLNSRTLRIVGETKFGNNVPVGCFVKEFKPFLRPMEDIKYYVDFLNTYYVDFDKIEGCLVKRKNENFTRLNELDFLFKNHFDVFGLIEKGLAVDINTLSVE